MIRRVTTMAIVLVLSGIIAVVGYAALRHSWETINFADEHLERAVRDTLGVSEGDLLASQVARISTLDAPHYGIVSLEGIEHLRNVRTINLEGNAVEDLRPLASLEKLETLNLRDNGIVSLESVHFGALLELPLLRSINLRHNVVYPDPDNPSVRIRLSNIELLSEFTDLNTLILRDNNIEDISPLAGLTNLRALDISLNPLSDKRLSDLTNLHLLEHLNVRETGVDDLTVVAGFTRLEYLNIHSNIDIVDLSPIANLTFLRTLIMRNVPMRDNMQYLANLTQLERLNIRNTGTSDVTLLATLMSQGALQDDPSGNVFASVDIRDNPIPINPDDPAQGYEPLRPYWRNISERNPMYLPGAIVINEFMASNGSIIADADGEYEDWIELYNPNDFPIDLAGHYLSDDPGNLTRWQFPSGTFIPANGHLMVWASGKNKTDADGMLHTNFSISRDGEPLFLIYADGETILDAVDAVFVPRDMSYGRHPDGSPNWEYFDAQNITPGASNSDANPGILPHDIVPIFSHGGGYYSDAFDLVIDAEEGLTIHYTLDGSTPTKDSPIYTGPIRIQETFIDVDQDPIIIQRELDPDWTEPPVPRPPLSLIKSTSRHWNHPSQDIFKAATVRAIAIDEQGRESLVITHTYIVDAGVQQRYSFAVLSITTDIENLFDYEKGIYVPGIHYDPSIPEDTGDNRTGNYFQRGEEWERPVHLEFFDESGSLLFAQNAGMRIHGGLSRKYAYKSYRFYARYDYDDSNAFHVPFFDDKDIDVHRRFIARGGGQAYRYTVFGEAYIHDLIKPLPLDVQYNRPVIILINGEYFGIRNIRDRIDRWYLEIHHGVNPDNVTILDGNGRLDDGSEAGISHYIYSRDYVRDNDMADPTHYAYASTLIDMENLATYYAMQLYIGNTDWPQNNVRYWRLNTDRYYPEAPYGHDGRWRWLVYDLDASFGASFGATTPEINGFERMTGVDFRTGELFVNLAENDDFRTYFINVYADMINSVFHPERATDLLDAYVAIYEVEMPDHIARYGHPSSMAVWRMYVNRMYTFAEERPDYARQFLIDYFDLSGEFTLTLHADTDRGAVHINTIAFDAFTEYLPADHRWEGTYLNDVPITLEALALEGYQFSHWEDGEGAVLGEDATITIETDTDTEIHAIFIPIE